MEGCGTKKAILNDFHYILKNWKIDLTLLNGPDENSTLEISTYLSIMNSFYGSF